MFASFSKAKYKTCFTFVSKAAIEEEISRELGLKKKILPIKNCRIISKKDMIYNNAMSEIIVDPETYEVKVDDIVLSSQPAKKFPLTQLYFKLVKQIFQVCLCCLLITYCY